MECSLAKNLKEDHETMKNPKLGKVFVMCPVLGTQICYWCCLHISNIADPMTRGYTIKNFTEYYNLIPKICNRTWDNIFETCCVCRDR